MLVGNIHLDTIVAEATVGQSHSHHTWNQEHKYGEKLEVAGCDGAATGTLHHLHVALALLLTKNTLNDVLVSTPIPEADDRSTNEHYETGILMVERVGIARCVDVGPVEHVSRTVAVVKRATEGHHVFPALNDTAATQC